MHDLYFKLQKLRKFRSQRYRLSNNVLHGVYDILKEIFSSTRSWGVKGVLFKRRFSNFQQHNS